MADNLTTPVGDGTVLAADDVGGVLYSRVKISFGADGAASDVATGNRFPVDIGSGPFAISASALPLPTGAATESTLSTLAGKLPTLGTKAGSGSVSVVPASDASFTVTGTVGVSGSVAVTGTFFQATQPISAASLPLPTGAATETTLSTLAGKLPTLGTKAASGSVSVTPSSDGVFSVRPVGRDHETVAASQSDQVLGGTGAAGDVLDGLLIVPATTSPGAVSIEYGATNITVFAGGADSVSNLVPFWVELGGIASVGGGWEVTTGANVSVLAVGDFT